MSKLKSLTALKKIVVELKKNGKKIVFTNGCFDLIHPGHIKTFRKAKTLGDMLVVGINSDASVKKLKGKSRPILNQSSRADVLSEMESVNYIVIFGDDTPLKVIKTIKPDVLVKGGDYKIRGIIGHEIAKKVVRVPLMKGFSTTNIIKNAKTR